MSVRRFLAEYFTFTRTERLGIRALLALIALLLAGLLFLPLLLPHPQPDYSRFDQAVSEFLADSQRQTVPKKEAVFFPSSTPRTSQGPTGITELQPFDPNGLAVEQWMAMGLSRKQAEAVKKYEEKIGRFRSKEDVRRIRVMPEEVFLRIEPYIRISENTSPVSATSQTDNGPVLDLNTATADELQTIRGIGEKLGPRIVAYREKLGGFYSVTQLKDIYGLSQENYEKIAPSLRVENAAVKKIHLNYAGVEELGRHPYIGFDLARKIIAERNRNGFFTDTRQIVTRGLADEQVYAKLVPYLTVQ